MRPWADRAMRPWASIRLRLAMITGLSVLLAGLAIAALSYVRLAHELEAADEEFARHEAIELSQMVAPLRTREEVMAEVRRRESTLVPEDGVDYLAVLDLSGQTLLTLPDGVAPELWPEGLDAARRGAYPSEPMRGPEDQVGANIRTVMLVRYAGEPRWFVLAKIDRTKSTEALARVLDSVVLGVPLAALAVFMAAYGLVALALRPVTTLVRDARKIAAEGPGQRLEVPPPGSEVEELARLLNVMLQRTEENMGRVRRFAADASHELRTPLARILGEAEMALRTSGDPRAALESIVAEVGALRTLVDGLLQLSRADTPSPIEGAFDLSALVQELAHEGAVLGETRGIELRLEQKGRGGEAWVRGSRELVGRAVWNLIDNGLKYVPRGGHVLVTLEVGDSVRVVVEDDGPGVPPPAWPRMFEPFFRADPARSETPGHGLGLPLSRSIARRHGGDLVFERSDVGARFVLSLPCRERTMATS